MTSKDSFHLNLWRIIPILGFGTHIINTDEKILSHIYYSVLEQYDLEESFGRAALMLN